MARFTAYPESITAVDRHFARLLSSPATLGTLHLRCTAKLTIPSGSIFKFSHHSILSNLHRGIEAIESAVNAGSADDRNALLSNSEMMLQIPAMLDEDAATAGIDNKFIVCCSYFHLAVIRKLWNDEWQMAVHFFQAVLVSPGYIRAEFTPELYSSLFGTFGGKEGDEEAARRLARRYKDCLMFYQVISYGESRSNQFKCFSRNKFVESDEEAPALAIHEGVKKGNQFDLDSDRGRKSTMATYEPSKFEDKKATIVCSNENFERGINDNFDQRRLQEMLEDSQSDSSVSGHSVSTEASDRKEFMKQVRKDLRSPGNGILVTADLSVSDIADRNCLRNISVLMHTPTCGPKDSVSSIPAEDNESNGCKTNSLRMDQSFSTSSIFYDDCQKDTEKTRRTSPRPYAECLRSFSSRFGKKCSFFELTNHGCFVGKKKSFAIGEKDLSEEDEKDRHIHLMEGFEKVVLALRNSEGSRNFEDVQWEMNSMWEMLHNKPEIRYNPAKQDILKQLLKTLSNSKRERDLRVSVSLLLGLISVDKTIIDDIKREKLPLCNLATALNRNVHEAAILIYLLNPSPSEIKSLELLPSLVEVACNSNKESRGMGSLTSTSASIAMIEILVTAFDYVTNNMHLAAISSPKVLSKLVNVAMNNNVGEGIALATILMRCMRLNGNCRKFLSQVIPIDPFVQLLVSDKMSAKLAALEYFHELLCMPRSSAIRLLRQIRQVGGDDIMRILLAFVKQVKNESQLLAANLLLQLGMLEGRKCRREFMEEAMGALLESIATGENASSTQPLSSFILSNVGGTFSWAGESYTAAWLVKRAGLTASQHRNMVRDIDWLDPCLQDSVMRTWSRTVGRIVMRFGRCIFSALAKGIRSQRQSVQRDCLVTTAWLGAEMADIGSGSLRYSACEILLDDVAAFLHPGKQLDERVLACLSVYNYTSGRGKMKLLNFSEGSRESLRRLSGVTWMAEELLNVIDYVLPTKSPDLLRKINAVLLQIQIPYKLFYLSSAMRNVQRVSCVHTQTLEIVNVGNGSATALIFYKGHLYTGYSDGSIKVWDIKDKRTVLLWEVKMHKRSVTCFAVYEAADSLLSGSIDKTVWRNVQKKFECVEVIQLKEAVQKLGACNEKILIVAQSRGLKPGPPPCGLQSTNPNPSSLDACSPIPNWEAYLELATWRVVEVTKALPPGLDPVASFMRSGASLLIKEVTGSSFYERWPDDYIMRMHNYELGECEMGEMAFGVEAIRRSNSFCRRRRDAWRADPIIQSDAIERSEVVGGNPSDWNVDCGRLRENGGLLLGYRKKMSEIKGAALI
ncbi:hypothetical protein KSP40_PGU022514 [Platanthera guangdongensis]|uniref:E3 ubiquitin-protein ligase LIN-1 n=1 Tax=Platanthera guangdongensis TaxID=2320717 RepID=A0ABR2M784_9ASPA